MSYSKHTKSPSAEVRLPGATVSVKLRDSCETCAALKIKCSKEKPTCSRCLNRDLRCEYGLSRRQGRTSAKKSDQGSTARVAATESQRHSGTINDVSTSTMDGISSRSDVDNLSASINNASPRDVDNEIVSAMCNMSAFPSDSDFADVYEHDIAHINEDSVRWPREQDMDILMVNEDIHIQDSMRAWEGMCCLTLLLDLLGQLGSEASTRCSRLGNRTESHSPPPTLETAIAKNIHIMEVLSKVMCCSCAQEENLLMIISQIIFRIIISYAAAIRNMTRMGATAKEGFVSSTPFSLKELLGDPPKELEGIIDGASGRRSQRTRMEAKLLLDELYSVQDLVNRLSQHLAKARLQVDPETPRTNIMSTGERLDVLGATADVSSPFSTASKQFEADLRRKLRAVSFETIQILLCG